jgi:AraC-like DNA-binding protein
MVIGCIAVHLSAGWLKKGEHRVRKTTVAATLFIDVAGYLERRGFRGTEVCGALGIDAECLQQPNRRVPGAWMEALWEAGERLTGDRHLGLHTAETYNPGALDVLGYVLLSCGSAGEALERLARYGSLLNDGLRVTVVSEGEQTQCRCTAVEGMDNFLLHSPRQVMEAMACGIVTSLRRLTAARVEPLAVSFRHEAPEETGEHRRIFGVEARFRQAENAISYRTADLKAGLLSANVALLSVFDARAAAALEQLEVRGPLSRRVLQTVAQRMRGRIPVVAEVAAALAISERSLQRELRAEGVSFRELVEEVQRTAAIEHLAAPGTTATEVAFLLGFSEPSAFTRAFRRWTGAAPTEYRAR